jgi:hypothetical protein
MLQEENSPNLQEAFHKLEANLQMEEKKTIEAVIEFINTLVLQLSKNPKEFVDIYNKIVAHLILNAPTLSLEEQLPGHTVVEASNNIVKFSRANITEGEGRSIELTNSSKPLPK